MYNKKLTEGEIKNFNKTCFVDRKVVLLLSKLPSLTMTLNLKGIQKIIYEIKHSSVP